MLERAIRSQINNGPVTVCEARQSFSELPGNRHEVSANAWLEVSRGTITVIRRFAELIRGSTARPRPISFCGAQVQDHGTRLDRIGAVASIGKLNARGKRIGIGLDRLHLTRGKELGRGAVSFCGNDGNKMGKISY